MRIPTSTLARELVAAAILSAAAVIALFAGGAKAADLDVLPPAVAACGPQEIVILFDEHDKPTVPARTPYFYCVTGTTLLPGEIPPPREYCCH